MRKTWFFVIFLFVAGCFGGTVAPVKNATAQDTTPVVTAPVETPKIVLIDELKKLPDFKSGIMYNWQDSKITHLMTTEVASWKGVTFELGLSANDALVAVASYKIAKLSDFGVKLPILNKVEFNLGYGVGSQRIDLSDGNGEGNNEFVQGLTLTLLNYKF